MSNLHLALGGLITFLSLTTSVQAASTCELDLNALPDFSGESFHGNFQQCLEQSTDGVLHRIVNSLELNFKRREASSGNMQFVYFYAPDGSVPFSIKEYRNPTGLYTYFRKGAGDNAETIFSRRQFRDEEGRLTYFRRGKANSTTVLSERHFANDHGSYSYWREGYQDDSKSFFTMRSFTEGGATYHYYRLSPKDESTFLSVKIRPTKKGLHTVYRQGFGNRARPILSVFGDKYRSGEGLRLTRSQASALLERRFWGPLLRRSLEQMNQHLKPALADFPTVSN